MPIQARTPTQLPATSTPARTYDRWWIAELRVWGDGSAPRATAVLRKYRLDEAGRVEFSPIDAPVVLRIDDVLTEAKHNPAGPLAAALAAIEAAILDLGHQRNVL